MLNLIKFWYFIYTIFTSSYLHVIFSFSDSTWIMFDADCIGMCTL